MSKAHVFGSQERTRDVQINEDVTFEGLILSENTLQGLTASCFERPSPIQLVAIPLGKCGFDLIAEAKSGTGKTVMFGVIALEMLQLPSKSLQVLILTPTREIAAQVGDVLANIGIGHEGLKVGVFIGGLPVEEDRRRAKHCHIAVGTPGRLKHLIDDSLLDVSHTRLIVIDEADKLLEPSFEPDIVHIFKTLPLNKQVIAASATYTPELKVFLEEFMRSPIRVNPEEKNLAGSIGVLLGVRQVAALVPHHPNYLTKFSNKLNALVAILSSVPFKQCIVFNNSHGVAQTISETLNSKGWPTEFISSGMDQPSRLKVVNKFYDFKCRVLLSTDLVSRGIDVANVNLVINLDVPMTSATYLHRVGRSGRFGTEGLAVTIVENQSKDLVRLIGMVKDLKIPMDCIKLDSAKPFKENIFTCELPTLLSEVPGEIEIKVPKQVFKKEVVKEDAVGKAEITIEAKEESVEDKSGLESSDDESSGSDSSNSGGVEVLSSDSDVPEETQVSGSQVPQADNLESDLQSELAEMHKITPLVVESTPPPKKLDWRQDENQQNINKQSPVRRLPFSSPRNSPQSGGYRQFSPGHQWRENSPQNSPGQWRDNSPQNSPGHQWRDNFNQNSPGHQWRDNFNQNSPGFQRREYSPQHSPYFGNKSFSPQYSPRFGTQRQDYSLSSSPYSTPRKDFGADKFVYSYAKYSDEATRSQEFQPRKFEYNPRFTSPQQQQYYQQQFECALQNLIKDIRNYPPPKVEQVLGYDELVASSLKFDKTAVCNPAFERGEPFMNRAAFRSITLGMSKHLGVQVNIAKRHFAFNGGIKGYLQKLVDGYEPDMADLPSWEPGLDGFRVSRDSWVYGNEYVESMQAAKADIAPEDPTSEPAEHPFPRPIFQPPRQQMFGDGVPLVVPPAPQEHHTLKFPSFPTEPGASLAKWKEQVKLTTFMIHYSEYFRMMNKQ